ncbi:uracil phosphoribosyltransferase [uncultured Helicobacter sp.]|uniref:uracil phosphoribosyltransferase n=1 Tax=uncultured Helicobacter sp. TaxID=175537 RepID=UPI00374F71F6
MFVELQRKYPLQNIINQARLKDTTSLELCKIHHHFGNLLGMEILGAQPLVSKTKTLATGKKENLCYNDDRNFVIIGILRAGLYIAEGVRAIFPKAIYRLANSPEESLKMLKNKKIILVDSVVNSGRTIEAFLQKIPSENTLYLATSVVYEPTKERLALSYALRIVTIRISKNSYIGQGGSDTGNRLFHTY